MIRFSKVLTLFVLLGISATLQAQFSGGGRLGVNLANLYGTSVQKNSMLIGYNVGGFFNYSMANAISNDFGEIFSLQAELTLQTKGTTLDFPALDENLETTTKSVNQVFSYVQVPVLAKFTFQSNSRNEMKFYGEGGFFLASLFGLSVDGEKSRDHDADPATDPRKWREEYAGFDLGLVVGGGVSIPFGGRRSPWEALGGVRYSHGLKNIGEPKEKTPDAIKESLEDIKTSTISILLGVSYKF